MLIILIIIPVSYELYCRQSAGSSNFSSAISSNKNDIIRVYMLNNNNTTINNNNIKISIVSNNRGEVSRILDNN